jgi:hypothetical protein
VLFFYICFIYCFESIIISPSCSSIFCLLVSEIQIEYSVLAFSLLV